MELYLVKPDLVYYERYNDMMEEWCADGSRIAPWFLDPPLDSIEKFEELVRLLDGAEHGKVPPQFASATSYFVVNEEGRLIGAASLRHYLTVQGLNTWGHIGYGVRPSERRKGYGSRMLKMMLEKAREKGIREVLVGVYETNIASRATIEKCGGVYENTVSLENEEAPIRRYWFKNY